MPTPKAINDQIRQIIPPLNGKLHKGQSGMSTLSSPHALPSHPAQAVSEYSEAHSSAFPNLIIDNASQGHNRTTAIREPHSTPRSPPNE